MTITETEIEKKVIDMVSAQLAKPAEEITRVANFRDDLGGDSLDEAELVMQLEEDFAIEVSDEEAANIRTVGDIIDFVKSKVV